MWSGRAGDPTPGIRDRTSNWISPVRKVGGVHDQGNADEPGASADRGAAIRG